jgi:hypothetical protein
MVQGLGGRVEMGAVAFAARASREHWQTLDLVDKISPTRFGGERFELASERREQITKRARSGRHGIRLANVLPFSGERRMDAQA